MSLMRAVATVGGLTMVSRVLGFARDVLVAAALGAGMAADAFFVAFKLPNFFRRLFAEGAFSAAFVPIFAETLTVKGHEDARRFAEDAMAALLAILLPLTVAAQLAMPWVMRVLAPGFASDPAKFDLAVAFTVVTFPYLLFISLVALQGGVLNALGRFAAVAATPVLLNLCLIGAVLVAARASVDPGLALAWGVFAAGALQFLWLVRSCRAAGMALRFRLPRPTPEIRRLLVLALPAAVGAGVAQINLVVDVILASFLPGGSVSYLFYADRLNELPIGVIGVAVGTALLPLIANRIAAGDEAGARAAQNRAIEAVLLFALPAGAGLMLLAEPLISVMFQRGAFDGAQASATAAALVAYSAGLPGYVLVKALTPGFYARQDTRTPVKIAIACVALNLALNLILMWPLLHVGLALSTAIASSANAAMLYVVLRRRGHFAPDDRLKLRVPRMAAAAAIMGAAVWALGQWFAKDLSPGDEIRRWSALLGIVGAGGLAYVAVAQILGAADWRELRRLLRRKAD
jgi:putative peptidoglycan lipid II flippase